MGAQRRVPPRGAKVWYAWLGGFIGVFGIVETIALREAYEHEERGGPAPSIDPLSAVLRHILLYDKGRPGIGWLGLIGFGGFWTWLIVHLAKGPSASLLPKPEEGVVMLEMQGKG